MLGTGAVPITGSASVDDAATAGDAVLVSSIVMSVAGMEGEGVGTEVLGSGCDALFPAGWLAPAAESGVLLWGFGVDRGRPRRFSSAVMSSDSLRCSSRKASLNTDQTMVKQIRQALIGTQTPHTMSPTQLVLAALSQGHHCIRTQDRLLQSTSGWSWIGWTMIPGRMPQDVIQGTS